jgi:hypothetical protein
MFGRILTDNWHQSPLFLHTARFLLIFISTVLYRVCPIGTDRRIFLQYTVHVPENQTGSSYPFTSLYTTISISSQCPFNFGQMSWQSVKWGMPPPLSLTPSPPPPSLWSSIAAPWRGPVQANYNYWSTCSMRHATSPLPLLMIYQ